MRRHLLVEAVAATWCAALAAVIVKLALLFDVSTTVGLSFIAAGDSKLGYVSWVGQDLVLGLAWGSVIALLGLLGLRWGRNRLVSAALLTLHFCFGSALVTVGVLYQLFGTHPSLSFLLAMEGAGAAVESVRAVANAERISLGLTVMAVMLLGPRLLASAVSRRLRTGMAVTLAIGVLVGLASSGADHQVSVLELDQNGLIRLLGSVWERNDLAQLPASGDLASALESVSGVARSGSGQPPREAYEKLRAWGLESRRNVIFVILETMAFRHLHLLEGKTENTPVLDELARRSVLWPFQYAHTPSSMHAIYTLLGGQYNLAGGDQISKSRPRIDCKSLPEVLIGRGYRAGLWHSGRFSFSAKDRFLGGRGFVPMLDALSMPQRESFKQGGWGVEEAATIGAILDWLESNQDRPTLSVYIPVYPHHPYTVPDPDYEKFDGSSSDRFDGLSRDIRDYHNAVYYMDSMIGMLMDGVRDLGMEDDTLVVFLGDHGEGFNEHGALLHGTKVYEESVRSFAMWYAPGALSDRYEDRRSFGQIDVLPTLFDIIGVPQQKTYPGMSAYREGPRPMIPIFTGFGRPLMGFVDGHWKYILNTRSDRQELFDLSSDPMETRSLAERHPERVSEYRRRVDEFVMAQKAWELGLEDLPERSFVVDLTDAKEMVWEINPKECDYDPSHFAVRDGLLRVLKRSPVRCVLDLAHLVGQITSFELHGVEGLGAASISADLTWRGSGGGNQPDYPRLLSHCDMNGKGNKPAVTQCVGVPSAEDGLFQGGQAVVEIKFRASGARQGPIPRRKVSRHHISQVKVRYKAVPHPAQAP